MARTIASVAAGPLVRAVSIPPAGLPGEWSLPADARGIVLFANGGDGSHLSPRNLLAANLFYRNHLGTLLFDLLTVAEARSRANDFDIELLTRRLLDATTWIASRVEGEGLPLGYFGTGTGAAAALRAAAQGVHRVSAIVSHGGRPDLAKDALFRIAVPTLILVGSDNPVVLALNRAAYAFLTQPKRLSVIPDAGRLVAEPSVLEEAATLAADWFRRYLIPPPRQDREEL